MSVSCQQLLRRLYDWLNCADSLRDADLICSLAGRRKRMIFAMKLFSQGRAPSVLLSVSPWEIGWGLQNLPWPVPLDFPPTGSSVRSMENHFFVAYDAGRSTVVQVDIGTFGTLSEIRALANWLPGRPHIVSLLVVSSAPHLRRVRMCCRALLPQRPQIRFLAVPSENAFLDRDTWWKNSRTRTMVISELPKIFLYSVLLRFHRSGGSI